MTDLYKKNRAVFIPAEITVEEVEKLKDDNKVMSKQAYLAGLETCF